MSKDLIMMIYNLLIRLLYNAFRNKMNARINSNKLYALTIFDCVFNGNEFFIYAKNDNQKNIYHFYKWLLKIENIIEIYI